LAKHLPRLEDLALEKGYSPVSEESILVRCPLLLSFVLSSPNFQFTPESFRLERIMLILFQSHIPYIKVLKNLRHLRLPDISYLGLGYEVLLCGNAYFEIPGFAEERQRDRDKAQKRLNDAIEELLVSPSHVDAAPIPGSSGSSRDLTSLDAASQSCPLPMLEDVSTGSRNWITVFKVVDVGEYRRLQ
jgi:hypothetical protein